MIITNKPGKNSQSTCLAPLTCWSGYGPASIVNVISLQTDDGPQALTHAARFTCERERDREKGRERELHINESLRGQFQHCCATTTTASSRQRSPALTDARLRVAGTALLDHALAHAVLWLAGAVAHLDSATALLAAPGPTAPRGPALCTEEEEERRKQGKERLTSVRERHLPVDVWSTPRP